MNREYDQKTLKKLQKVELEILRDFIEICEKHNIQYFGIAGTAIGAIRHQGFIPWDDDIDIGMLREDYERFLEVAKQEMVDKYYILNAEEDKNYPLMTTRLVKKGTKFVETCFKNSKCNLGIFLDLYALDNVSNNKKILKKQAREVWFWSKLMILRAIPHPVLPFKGVKGNVIQMICGIIHYTLVVLRVPKTFLYKKCKRASCKFNEAETQRVAYLADTNPYGNMITKEELFPLKKVKFEEIEISFPNNIEQMLKTQYGDYMQLPPIEKRKNHCPDILEFDTND